MSQTELDELFKKISTLINWAWIITTIAFAAGGFVIKLEINQSAIEEKVTRMEVRDASQEGTINELKTVNGRIDERLKALSESLEKINQRLEK